MVLVVLLLVLSATAATGDPAFVDPNLAIFQNDHLSVPTVVHSCAELKGEVERVNTNSQSNIPRVFELGTGVFDCVFDPATGGNFGIEVNKIEIIVHRSKLDNAVAFRQTISPCCL